MATDERSAGRAPVSRAIRGDDLVDLAAATGARNRALRHVGSYLHELTGDDRAHVCDRVAAMLEKSARIDQLFIDWLRSTDGG